MVADTPSFEDAHEAISRRGRRGRHRDRLRQADQQGRVDRAERAIGGPGAEEHRRRGRHPAQLAARVSSGCQPGAATRATHRCGSGPGITSGLNAVTAFGCPDVAKGEFFSPTPGLDMIDQLDPDFNTAYAEVRRGSAGRRHRAAAVGAEQGDRPDARGHRTGARPGGVHEHAGDRRRASTTASTRPIVFTPDDHFGGTGAHLLDADCDEKQFTTAEQFVEAG